MKQSQKTIRFGQKFKSIGESIRTYTITGVDELFGMVYLVTEPGDMRVRINIEGLERKLIEGEFVKIN